MLLLLACAIPVGPSDGGAPLLPLANCTGIMQFDAGLDGILEGQWTFFYNRFGEPETATYDTQADGKDDSQMRYLYDDRDRLVARTWDGNGDGVMETRYTYHYDESDRLVELREDMQDDGHDDRRRTYTYGETGPLLHEYAWSGETLSTMTYEGSYSYAQDFNSAIVWHTPGATTTRVSRFQDERGLLIHEETDKNLDGVLDQAEDTLWDDERRILQVDKDADANGSADYRSTWHYDCP